MIRFRNIVGNAPRTSWWDNDKNQIAFCRGTRGFIAFNNEPNDMNEKLFTCLQSGIYCDIISGQKIDGKCTGSQVMVDDNGEAEIRIPSNIGVLAIHIGVNLNKSIEYKFIFLIQKQTLTNFFFFEIIFSGEIRC